MTTLKHNEKEQDFKKYCQYQVLVIVRWCSRYHLSEMDFVTLEAKKFAQRHRG